MIRKILDFFKRKPEEKEAERPFLKIEFGNIDTRNNLLEVSTEYNSEFLIQLRELGFDNPDHDELIQDFLTWTFITRFSSDPDLLDTLDEVQEKIIAKNTPTTTTSGRVVK